MVMITSKESAFNLSNDCVAADGDDDDDSGARGSGADGGGGLIQFRTITVYDASTDVANFADSFLNRFHRLSRTIDLVYAVRIRRRCRGPRICSSGETNRVVAARGLDPQTSESGS